MSVPTYISITLHTWYMQHHIHIHDTTYTHFAQSHCILKRFTKKSALQCLRNRHILLLGDSVTRYQYMSLASLLHRAYPRDIRGSGRVCMPGQCWSGWREFYLETSRAFEGKELCDCYRCVCVYVCVYV